MTEQVLLKRVETIQTDLVHSTLTTSPEYELLPPFNNKSLMHVSRQCPLPSPFHLRCHIVGSLGRDPPQRNHHSGALTIRLHSGRAWSSQLCTFGSLASPPCLAPSLPFSLALIIPLVVYRCSGIFKLTKRCDLSPSTLPCPLHVLGVDLDETTDL